MGQFAIIGILTTMFAFVFLVMRIGAFTGSSEYEETKIAGTIWFMIFIFGVLLTFIP